MRSGRNAAFNFFSETTCFLQRLHHFTALPAIARESPTPHGLFSTHFVVFNFSHPSKHKVILSLILISLPLITGDIGHVFMCVLAFYIFSLDTCLFKSLSLDDHSLCPLSQGKMLVT